MERLRKILDDIYYVKLIYALMQEYSYIPNILEVKNFDLAINNLYYLSKKADYREVLKIIIDPKDEFIDDFIHEEINIKKVKKIIIKFSGKKVNEEVEIGGEYFDKLFF